MNCEGKVSANIETKMFRVISLEEEAGIEAKTFGLSKRNRIQRVYTYSKMLRLTSCFIPGHPDLVHLSEL